MNEKWEYFVLREYHGLLASTLNKLGEDRWELVTCHRNESSETVAYFKRRKEQKQIL